MKFKKEELQDVILQDAENLTLVEDNIEETTRWSELHTMVFLDNNTGKHYESDYSCGLTELQDEYPYEYDDEEIECQEVVEQEITVKKWVSKEN